MTPDQQRRTTRPMPDLKLKKHNATIAGLCQGPGDSGKARTVPKPKPGGESEDPEKPPEAICEGFRDVRGPPRGPRGLGQTKAKNIET
jgi:hypothetical protein